MSHWINVVPSLLMKRNSSIVYCVKLDTWIVKGWMGLQNNCFALHQNLSINHDHHTHTGESKAPSQAFELFFKH